MENRQIGWSQEAILLHRISKELERLAGLIASIEAGGGGGGGGCCVTQTITNGDTVNSPSSEAVYEALLGKQNNITVTATGTTGNASFNGTILNIPNYAAGPLFTLTLQGNSGAADYNPTTHVLNIPVYTSSMQVSYDNSSPAKILINTSTIGPVIVQMGTGFDTDGLFEFRDGGGILRGGILANGNFYGTKIINTAAPDSDMLLADGTTLPQNTFVTTTGTAILTNKTIVKRTNYFISTIAPVSVTPNAFDTDIFCVSPLYARGNVAFNGPSGIKTFGQMLLIMIRDDGTSRHLDWAQITDGDYKGTADFPLPSATIINKWMRLLFQWNEDAGTGSVKRWELISIVNSA